MGEKADIRPYNVSATFHVTNCLALPANGERAHVEDAPMY